MTTSTPAVSSEDLLICTACGTQFDEINPQKLTSCRICDDRMSPTPLNVSLLQAHLSNFISARQFVPLSGQAFTTLGAMKNSSYTNKYKDFEFDSRITSIWTEPKFAIGQRCILIRTPVGNVLWDCLTYLDHETVAYIKSQGGLEAILISHPHYYSTHLEWAEAFNCPVYLSVEDEEWLCRADKPVSGSPTDDVPTREFIGADSNEFGIPSRDGKVTGVQALKLGGHFPGSLVCLFDGRLMVADTLVTTPAGLGNWKDLPRPKGMNSFAFMWSIPNVRDPITLATKRNQSPIEIEISNLLISHDR
jgi:glyoxylase-like metal-dependent hydrolase (beta-lactamase superfamily II)